jgi:hypothetical protein
MVIFERFSNLFNKLLDVVALVAMTFLILPISAHGQDPGYAPPPMFDDMTPPMVRPLGQDGYIVAPKSSTNTQLPEPTPQRAPIVTPRVSIDPDKPRPVAPPPIPPAPQKPVPAEISPPVLVPPAPAVVPAPPVAPTIAPAPEKPKMMKPIVEETYIKREKPAPKKEKPKKTEEPRTEEVKKAVPPSAPSKPDIPAGTDQITPPSAEAPVIKPVPRDPSQSAIQGPKTMPALPTEGVDEQVIFDAKTPPPETIMERHQKEAEKKTEKLMPIVPAPNPNVKPAAFDNGEQGVLKKSIPFQPGQIGLTDADADPIIAGVVKELDEEEKADWRVQIRSFATPHGDGLSSDRRISLSRALSLRSSMITQGVPASKIDVMAEGLQTDPSKPGDRIDLYLYGPPQQ